MAQTGLAQTGLAHDHGIGQDGTGQDGTGQNGSGHDGVGLSSEASRAEDAAGPDDVKLEVEVEREGSAPDTSWKEWWAASGRRRPERSVNPRSVGSSRARLHIPQRGEKKALLEMVSKNAGEELLRHRLKRSTDHNARARALNALQDALDLPEAPLRIECYDMSHLQGTDYVGSMVVMEDGLARPSEYKRFKVRNVPGNDDYAAMEEVLTRRLTAYLEEKELPVGERKRHFSYPPQLLLVDGGKGQLNVAIRVLEELGLEDEIPVAALAKQFEEVYLPGMADPIRVPRGSEALYLLQQVRDEAHRFAITYHRKLRDKRMTVSALDGVPGLGPARRKRLLREIGSVKAVKEAPKERLEALPWLPQPVVDALWDKLHGPAAAARADAGVARRRRDEWAEAQRAAEERSAEQMEQMGQDERSEREPGAEREQLAEREPRAAQEHQAEREPRADRAELGGREGPAEQADEAEADISGQGTPARHPDALVAPI